MGRAAQHLDLLCRWYIYAIHGYFAEVTFTATWDFIECRDWRMRGSSSVWALLIYGTFGLILEKLYRYLKNRCNILVRGLIYTLCIYMWEFGTGYALRCFNACPWDYSDLPYNYMGLVTAQYCPYWLVGSLLLERLVICCTLWLRMGEPWVPQQSPTARVTRKDD